MATGFYVYKNNIYHGSYPEDQVSGGRAVSVCRPETILTDRPFSKDTWAVHLWENHRLLGPERQDLGQALSKAALFAALTPEQPLGFSQTEARTGVPFPAELRAVYAAIHGHEDYFTAPEHFLPLDAIFVDQNVLVFFQKKRTPLAGYDLASGRLARYAKKAWHIENSDVSCWQFCVGRIVTTALEQKPAVKKGRCKGRFVTTLDIERELAPFCNERYHLLTELGIYGIAVLYTEEGLIAWIRSNGSYGDIHAGAPAEAQLEDLQAHLGLVAWR